MDLNRKGQCAGLLSLVFCAALISMTSCKLHDDNQVSMPPVAFVSLYQASPDAPRLDIMADNSPVNTYPFGYSDRTGYLQFLTGQRHLRFSPSGANNVVIDTTVTLENNLAYSVFVVDEYKKASILVLKDNTTQPASGKAMVRFLDLSPDAPTVNLSVKGQTTPLFSNQAFKAPSDFKEVDAMTSDFQIKSYQNSNLVLNIPDVELQQGLHYTILVKGFNSPPAGNANILSAQVIPD